MNYDCSGSVPGTSLEHCLSVSVLLVQVLSSCPTVGSVSQDVLASDCDSQTVGDCSSFGNVSTVSELVGVDVSAFSVE